MMSCSWLTATTVCGIQAIADSGVYGKYKHECARSISQWGGTQVSQNFGDVCVLCQYCSGQPGNTCKWAGAAKCRRDINFNCKSDKLIGKSSKNTKTKCSGRYNDRPARVLAWNIAAREQGLRIRIFVVFWVPLGTGVYCRCVERIKFPNNGDD